MSASPTPPGGSQARPQAQRHARGKRPSFYRTEGMDQAMSMILVLAQELSVLRDRVDAIEQVSRRRGIDLAKEIDELPFDQAALDAREHRRQELFERLYYLTRKEAAELVQADTTERYRAVIDELAGSR